MTILPEADKTPSIQICESRPEDSQAIADIYNQSIKKGEATMDTEAKSAADVLRQMAAHSDRECYLVAEQNGRILAWGSIKKVSDRWGYRTSCETSVYVSEDYLRQGLGTRMKYAIIERCKRYQYRHLMARVFADNEASVNYNKKLGFQLVGVQRQVGFLQGRWMDVAILQLILEDVPPYQPN